MDKRPIISIKVKIILLMAISLLCAVTFYSYFAINLFTEDKKAYIFEDVLSSSQSIAKEIDASMTLLQQEIQILNKLIQIERNSKALDIILKSKDIKNVFLTKSLSFLKESTLSNTEVPVLENNHFSIHSGILFYKDENTYLLDIAFLQSIIDQNRVYSSVISNSNSQLITDNLIETRGFTLKHTGNLVEYTLKNFSENSVKITNILDKQFIYAASAVKKYGLQITSIIDYDKAFFITDYLVKKSILFGLFILLFISAIAILFSKSISTPIQLLFEASNKLASGNFDTNVHIRSNDEIGHLGNAFNYMASEIKRYMIEMQEKLRLENEIKVAKMVQDNFFPAQNIEEQNFEIAAFNEASSECGGDWWGYYSFEDNGSAKLLFIIADATGHGVPAALLTSSINTAFNAAKSLIKSGALQANANEVMTFLNKTLAQTKTEILLTSFIGIIDFNNNTLNYCNSSHLDPYILPHKSEALEKSDIVPLIEAKGARLGQNIDFKYSVHTHKLSKGDIILLQTDGLIECKNKEGQEFGMRRFLKSILVKADNVFEFRDNIIKTFKEFCEKVNYEDDITLVSIKIK